MAADRIWRHAECSPATLVWLDSAGLAGAQEQPPRGLGARDQLQHAQQHDPALLEPAELDQDLAQDLAPGEQAVGRVGVAHQAGVDRRERVASAPELE
jgi:hypothetical protein